MGARYDASRVRAETGVDLSLGGKATGSVSIRGVGSTADVRSPAGGGTIDAKGVGVLLGVSAIGEILYAKGGLSLTRYEVDVSSSDAHVGVLAQGVGASGSALSVEAGAQTETSDNVRLTPRVWMTRAAVDVDDFTDAAASRVSVGDAARVTGGVGIGARIEREVEGGRLTLRGSLDVAQLLSGETTSVEVSGEREDSASPRTRMLLGLAGTYRSGRVWIGAQLAAGGIGSGNASCSGRFSFGWKI